MIKFVSLRGNKTHLYAITSRNSNNPLLICRAFHPRTSHSITNTIYRASHHLCEVENDSQLYKKEEWLADSPTVISLQRWGWMPEDQTVSSLPSLPRSAVLMPWLVLGGYRFASRLAGYLKTGLKKINKQLTGCRRKTLVCFIVLSWLRGRNGAFLRQLWKNYRVSIEYAAYSAFYWATPVKKNDILNIWWLKTGPPDSHIVNHIPLMNKYSS